MASPPGWPSVIPQSRPMPSCPEGGKPASPPLQASKTKWRPGTQQWLFLVLVWGSLRMYIVRSFPPPYSLFLGSHLDDERGATKSTRFSAPLLCEEFSPQGGIFHELGVLDVFCLL